MTNDSNIQIPAFGEDNAKAEESAEPIGQITPAQYRPSVFASQGLSKRYIPTRRGTRLDIPAWSVRENPTFFTKA